MPSGSSQAVNIGGVLRKISSYYRGKLQTCVTDVQLSTTSTNPPKAPGMGFKRENNLFHSRIVSSHLQQSTREMKGLLSALTAFYVTWRQNTGQGKTEDVQQVERHLPVTWSCGSSVATMRSALSRSEDAAAAGRSLPFIRGPCQRPPLGHKIRRCLQLMFSPFDGTMEQ